MFFGFASLPICAGLALSQGAPNREASASKAPIIRAIVINRSEVFDSVEAREFWGFGLVNALHVQTRPYVVRRELLFEVGEPFDTARVNESAGVSPTAGTGATSAAISGTFNSPRAASAAVTVTRTTRRAANP